MKTSCLLLTGTINPGAMVFTKLTDPDLRRNQYLESINYWLKHTSLPIIFVENSGIDLSEEISKQDAGRIEFLTFQGNEYDKKLGKGFGEMKCLEYAYRNSRFLNESDFVFKVTGRLKVLNFKKFLTFYNNNQEILFLLDFKDSLKFADSRLFGFYPKFINEYLIKYQQHVNDSEGKVFENFLAKAALEAIAEGKIYKQMPFYPRLAGVSGTENQPYSTNFLYYQVKQLKYFLKARFISGF